MKKLVGIFSLFAIILTSCGEDENEPKAGTLTPDEASTQINVVADQMDSDIVEMVESEGVQALEDFAKLFEDVDSFENSREEQQNWVKERISLISHAFVSGPTARVSDDDFSFDDIKGIWEWNAEKEEFEKSADAEVFTILFPTEGSSTNNAELSITKLEFVTITDADEYGEWSYEEPSEIEAYLKVGDITYINVDVSITWNEFGVPTKASALLDIVPFSFALAFDDTQASSASASASISKSNETLMAVAGTITFASSEKEEVTFVEGFVQYANLKIAGTVDATFEWSDDENGAIDDLNDFVDLEVLIDDEKVGDILFEDDIAYVVYADGTKENLEEILEPILQSIEDALDEFED